MKQIIYECKECGLHYRDKVAAKACQAFCVQFNACNIDIAKKAIENEVAA